jgi:chromate transporter
LQPLSGVPASRVVTRRDLFLAFLLMGLVSFGGVLPWARRILVEQRGWLSDKEFLELLSLGQMLPGPNVVNVSIMVGNRFQGATGALLSITGLLLVPFLVILLLAILYTGYGHVPGVQRAFAGTAAAAAGLVVAMGLKMLAYQPRSWQVMLLAAAAFAGSGLLGLPLLSVLAVLAPLGILLIWKTGHE